MKHLAIAVFAFFTASSLSYAHNLGTTFRVLGVKGEVLYESSRTLSPGASLGQVSNDIFEAAVADQKLHLYQGSEAGVSGVEGLGSALEVISNSEMDAYGWCYRIDGKTLNVLANQYVLTGHETKIEWFYAYAHLYRNDWTMMCIPADHRPVQE